MTPPPVPPVRLILSACADPQSADIIAKALVDEHLAACVNMLPGVSSTYRWHGVIEQAHEVLLLIKTTADRQDALIARLRALHSYELPEAVVVEAVGGLAPYLQWVAEQTRKDD